MGLIPEDSCSRCQVTLGASYVLGASINVPCGWIMYRFEIFIFCRGKVLSLLSHESFSSYAWRIVKSYKSLGRYSGLLKACTPLQTNPYFRAPDFTYLQGVEMEGPWSSWLQMHLRALWRSLNVFMLERHWFLAEKAAHWCARCARELCNALDSTVQPGVKATLFCLVTCSQWAVKIVRRVGGRGSRTELWCYAKDDWVWERSSKTEIDVVMIELNGNTTWDSGRSVTRG